MRPEQIKLINEIKKDPTQYAELLLQGFNSGILDFDEQFKLLMYFNEKYQEHKPVDQLLAEIQTKEHGIQVSWPTDDMIKKFITEVE